MVGVNDLNLDIPESGAAFVFGKNAPGRFYIKNDSIISVSCGESHAAVVTTSGRVFTFGGNENGQLGLGHCNLSPKPSCVKSLKNMNEKAVRVACGILHTLVTTESGNLYGFGCNHDHQLTGSDSIISTPVLLDVAKGKTVRDLTAGRSFNALVTKEGDLFTWGDNSEGCLGCGNDVSESSELIRVDIPGQVTSVSAGTYHCGCITSEGKLFMWGEVESGKLAFLPEDSKIDYVYHPTEVKLPEPAISVACGQMHTLVLLQSGAMLSFGDGSCGQLGLGQSELSAEDPTSISALANIKIINIGAGEQHSAAVSVDGHLYTFGDGSHGKLGPHAQDGYTNQLRPFRVSPLRPLRVRRVVCGALFTLILATPRQDGDSGYAGNASSEEDDPMKAMTAKSPRPFRRETLDAEGLSRRPSLLAREKRRQETVSSVGGFPDIPQFELTRRPSNRLSATTPAGLSLANGSPDPQTRNLDVSDTNLKPKPRTRRKVDDVDSKSDLILPTASAKVKEVSNSEVKQEHVMAKTQFDDMLAPAELSPDESEDDLNKKKTVEAPVPSAPASLPALQVPAPETPVKKRRKKKAPPPAPLAADEGQSIAAPAGELPPLVVPKKRAPQPPKTLDIEDEDSEVEPGSADKPADAEKALVPNGKDETHATTDEPDPTLASKPSCGGSRKVTKPDPKPKEPIPDAATDPTVVTKTGCGGRRKPPPPKTEITNGVSANPTSSSDDPHTEPTELDKPAKVLIPDQTEQDPTVAKSTGCGSKRPQTATPATGEKSSRSCTLL